MICSSAKPNTFCWTEQEKSLVKGAFYYGYMVLQVPGGRLAEVYGTRKVLGVATIISSVLTLMTASAASISPYTLAFLRAGIGLAQGVLFPCINPMLVR